MKVASVFTGAMDRGRNDRDRNDWKHHDRSWHRDRGRDGREHWHHWEWRGNHWQDCWY